MSKTVLVVDDDDIIRTILCQHLADVGYSTAEYACGDDAWRVVQSGFRPDALVSDIRMPGIINGITLAGRVLAIIPDLPVVLITGYSDVDTGAVIVKNKIPVLRKPFGIREVLIPKLREIMK